jgi:membrane-associated phospholipid phosphatase
MAQVPYRISMRTDAPVYGASLAMLGAYAYLGSRLPAFTESELNALTPPSLPAWEALALNRWDEGAAKRSDVVLFAAFGAAGMVALAQTPKNTLMRDGLVLGSLWFQTNLSTLMLTDLAKNSFRRNRPFVYNSQAPLIDRMESDARKSFFSGHSSMTACNTFFAAKIWSDMHPNSKLKPWVWTAAAAVPAYAALQRVQAGKHYPSDVIVGLAVGAAMGYLIPQIHLTR